MMNYHEMAFFGPNKFLLTWRSLNLDTSSQSQKLTETKGFAWWISLLHFYESMSKLHKISHKITEMEQDI